MSAQPPPGPQPVDLVTAGPCPHWCAVPHVAHQATQLGEVVHVGGPLVVKGTVLRLASSIDPTGAPDDPIVTVGDDHFSLYQAEVLIDALTQLVDEGTRRTQFTGRSADTGSPTR